MPPDMLDVLIVEDDPIVGQLTLNLLLEAGLKAELTMDSEEVISLVRKNTPKAMVMDVMMPGIDGITLLKTIKKDPEMKKIKVAMVSGKSFLMDKQKAYKMGADLFIEKPYDVKTFAEQIQRLVKTGDSGIVPTAPVLTQEPKNSGPTALLPRNIQLRIWGCRGLSASIPNQISQYGHQTSCVSLETPHGLFILDAGSGIIPLGNEILKRNGPKEMWILLTHFHMDHILGLGAFPCAQQQGYKIHVGGANDPEKNLQTLIQDVFYGSFSSIPHPPKSQIDIYELLEDSYELVPQVKLHTLYSNHPSTTLGFKFEIGGKKIIYCPDSEVYGEDVTALQDYDEKLSDFCQGADLLIHDAQYTEEDYLKHKNEGHSSAFNVLELADNAKIKKLIFFHHNPSYSDEVLDKILAKAQNIIRDRKGPLQCDMAREGLLLEL
ncbi:MAG: response regulator [Elusimicrobia bacterium]|nr:response regulator [Elusimicrobiota bacterium]